MNTNVNRHRVCGAVSAQHALVSINEAISAASAWQGPGSADFAKPRAYTLPTMAAKRGAPPRGNQVI